MAAKKVKRSPRAVAAAAVNGSGDAPEGFRKIETHLMGFWKPEKAGQTVQGIVGEAVERIGLDGKPNTFYSITLTTDDAAPIKTREDGKTIAVTAGQMIGVGGKMLLVFLRGREGKEVYLRYSGLGPAKRGQNAPKLFDTYEREGDE